MKRTIRPFCACRDTGARLNAGRRCLTRQANTTFHPRRDILFIIIPSRGSDSFLTKYFSTSLSPRFCRPTLLLSHASTSHWNQIYNDHVYDLLSNEIEQKPLSILDSASNVIAGTTAAHKDFPTGERGAAGQGSRYRHCVVGLSVHHVENAEQALRLLQRGAGNRRVRSTQV